MKITVTQLKPEKDNMIVDIWDADGSMAGSGELNFKREETINDIVLCVAKKFPEWQSFRVVIDIVRK